MENRVYFYKPNRADIEFEIFKLSRLFSRRAALDYAIDTDHRVHFYLILLFTEGEGIHRIDFHP